MEDGYINVAPSTVVYNPLTCDYHGQFPLLFLSNISDIFSSPLPDSWLTTHVEGTETVHVSAAQSRQLQPLIAENGLTTPDADIGTYLWSIILR